MKKLIYTLAILFTVPMFFSCEKTDIAEYSGDDAIYFDQVWPSEVPWFDSTRLSRQYYSLISFGKMSATDSLLHVRVQTAGYTRDYDRPFGVEIVKDSTSAIEGDEYELLTTSPSIAAGANSTYIDVLVHNSERMTKETVQIQLRLIAGDYFTLPFGSTTGVQPKRANGGDVYTDLSSNSDPAIHNIFANRFLTKPVGWNNLQFGYYFSVKKYELLLKLAGERFGWGVEEFEDKTTMLQFRAQIVARIVSAYLLEQYKLGRDYWVLDEDGSMMYVNGVSWSEGTMPENMV
jgi:hypothetical protein